METLDLASLQLVTGGSRHAVIPDPKIGTPSASHDGGFGMASMLGHVDAHRASPAPEMPVFVDGGVPHSQAPMTSNAAVSAPAVSADAPVIVCGSGAPTSMATSASPDVAQHVVDAVMNAVPNVDDVQLAADLEQILADLAR